MIPGKNLPDPGARSRSAVSEAISIIAERPYQPVNE
jgi:hypothetical protein